ncbi:MAG: hypothetical protein OMM_11544 [Candidatus Magnetoglobus multicellularis str. Araruama]|uniref:Uncharacterized protein n=1 Tax=Candidatus Magnetoglobus multicellularis str. Araruama TaxID=890399 RepID=A0A1V1NY61_9BACT|nr:MAG: hypothetical protein OMM_11544 [Candidatus Magnetoglobus multicellularis str. Araruama]
MIELFPDICAVLGKEGIHRKNTLAINNAKKYEIAEERCLLRYISLTYILGDNFDKNPEYKKIHLILNDTNVRNSSKKIDDIFSIIELAS